MQYFLCLIASGLGLLRGVVPRQHVPAAVRAYVPARSAKQPVACLALRICAPALFLPVPVPVLRF